MNDDIRWIQRYSNYRKALAKLKESIDYIQSEESKISGGLKANRDVIRDEILREGLIQRFEYTHELAWNVIKDYIAFQGATLITGSRDATREAFSMNLISEGEIWMDMIRSRNLTSHTYNEDTAWEIYTKILTEYYVAFDDFQRVMDLKLPK